MLFFLSEELLTPAWQSLLRHYCKCKGLSVQTVNVGHITIPFLVTHVLQTRPDLCSHRSILPDFETGVF